VTSHAPRPLRVLVVDDERGARLGISRTIEEWGYEVLLAANGEEAWHIQSRKAVDVILSDWQMPKVDGYELCARVRAAEKNDRYTYFIFMTGHSDRDHFARGVEIGADDFLSKPIDLEELRARLISASRVTSLHRRLSERSRMARRDSRVNFIAARTDPLTEVPNRLRLQEDLEALHARGARYGHRYAVALCDLDHFKKYNDHFGHLAGDEALRRAAHCIRDHLRRGDTVYRYGGEEFLVVLPEQSLPEAVAAMERVRRSLEALAIEHAPEAPNPVLTISVGVAEITPVTGGPEDWVARADASLYEAKARGRNRVVPEVSEVQLSV
jgi:diguanylate cyclase (GGDEF)-like protein